MYISSSLICFSVLIYMYIFSSVHLQFNVNKNWQESDSLPANVKIIIQLLVFYFLLRLTPSCVNKLYFNVCLLHGKHLLDRYPKQFHCVDVVLLYVASLVLPFSYFLMLFVWQCFWLLYSRNMLPYLP